MGKGRKPTPPEVKKLLGNPGKRDIKFGPAFTPADDLTPPDWLDEIAAAEWNSIVPELHATGVLMKVSVTVLGAYCLAVSNMRQAQELILADGVVMDTPFGKKRNPATTILAESVRIIQSLASEFGLTPASKGKVGGRKKATDVFEEWKATGKAAS